MQRKKSHPAIFTELAVEKAAADFGTVGSPPSLNRARHGIPRPYVHDYKHEHALQGAGRPRASSPVVTGGTLTTYPVLNPNTRRSQRRRRTATCLWDGPPRTPRPQKLSMEGFKRLPLQVKEAMAANTGTSIAGLEEIMRTTHVQDVSERLDLFFQAG
ncbi:hypothetical protein THAOC_36925, partial [Thalassiosira oceanica]